MNKERTALILSIGAIGIALVALFMGAENNTLWDENIKLKSELEMVKSYDEFKYEEWKKNNQSKNTIGCGITTELRSDGNCYPNPEI